MPQSPAIVWFRQDLRLADNPALAAAIASGRPVVPVYVLDEDTPGDWRPGGASRWWLHRSLAALDRSLAETGSRLVLRRGDAIEVIPALARETGAGAVFWNRCYEPEAIVRDKGIKACLKLRDIDVESFNAALLFEPWQVTSQKGTPLKVFTPYWRALRQLGDPATPLPAPARIPAPDSWPGSDQLAAWNLLPRRPNWASGFEPLWQPGEAGAAARLESFLENSVDGYRGGRDVPAADKVSRLSPHLHFGEIGPRQIWHRAIGHAHERGLDPFSGSVETFLKELVWREFSYNLLYHNPTLPELCLRAEFEAFPWNEDPAALAAWQKGRTGYPIVDAGMRELWHTGYMRNRVRMIAASFLVKHLFVDWRAGAAWFWDTLLDADLANNSASWQWVAGCGADAAPYFRIFNPVLQGEKFDADGAYVRKWVPEIAALPDRVIHRPWEASATELRAAGVRLGDTYPRPIVDHAEARRRALAEFERLKDLHPAEAAA